MGLIFALFNVALSRDEPFANCSSSNTWFYQCSPLFPFLHCRIGDKITICGMHIMVSMQDIHKRKCSASRGTSYIVLCLEY